MARFSRRDVFGAVPALAASAIFLMMSFPKFSGAPDTLQIFGLIEAWTRRTLGIDGLFTGALGPATVASAELLAAALLIIGTLARRPLVQGLGGLFGTGIISGALFFHLVTDLGIAVPFVTNGCPLIDLTGGGGAESRAEVLSAAQCAPDTSLFTMALIAFLTNMAVLFFRRRELMALVPGKSKRVGL